MLSRFHAILVTKYWSLSDLDTKLKITDTDPHLSLKKNDFKVVKTQIIQRLNSNSCKIFLK